MKRIVYSSEFKVSAVKLVQEQGYTIGKAAEHLGVDPGSLRGWVHKFGTPASEAREPVGEAAVRAGGVPSPARGEPAAPHGTRDFKKSGHLLGEPAALRFQFMKEHEHEFPVKIMARVLGLSRSGYYA